VTGTALVKRQLSADPGGPRTGQQPSSESLRSWPTFFCLSDRGDDRCVDR